MRSFDVFNGDADGICGLHQLRLAYPRDAILITGVKRDIALLQQVPHNEKADVTVLDISLDENVEALQRVLSDGGRVTWFDHHSARMAFSHPNLNLYWDEDPGVCTSILVDRYLRGRFRSWAVVAAFGDNLRVAAGALASSICMPVHYCQLLEELGKMLNYNAYGEHIDDLHVAPEVLYRELHSFISPFEFIDASPCYQKIVDGYWSDAACIGNLAPECKSDSGAVYVLPCEPWARRISGVLANVLIEQGPSRSYAVLTERRDGTFSVSVRSALPSLRPANALCARFPGGGGRKAAAGINALPASELDDFMRAFFEYFKAMDAVGRAGVACANPL
ncbi:hypothetical protein EGT07_03630 [Herbaspirillum sp. HC18]|nr:hypothetical protein EGT07_03630 [Herbaspirillum sp. HC18]